MDVINTDQEIPTMRTSKSAERGRTLRVKFLSTEGMGGNDDVRIGHNGVVNVYKRDVPVDVPEKFLKVVDDGIITIKNEDGSMVNKKRFPYEIVREAA